LGLEMAGTTKWLPMADGPLGELPGDWGMVSRELLPPGAEAGPAPGSNGGAGSFNLGDIIRLESKTT